jgi:hypothetical protein
MGNLFDLKESGYFYTRLQNPTNDVVASKIAALEGGVAAMLTSWQISKQVVLSRTTITMATRRCYMTITPCDSGWLATDIASENINMFLCHSM